MMNSPFLSNTRIHIYMSIHKSNKSADLTFFNLLLL